MSLGEMVQWSRGPLQDPINEFAVSVVIQVSCCLVHRYRVRPSALLSVLQGAGFAAGAAAALVPGHTRNAVLGALQETLTDLYNDQLRTLRAAGLSEEVCC